MFSSEFFPVVQTDKTATILSGQTVSAEIDLFGTQLVGLYMPTAFTGASLKLQAAPVSGGTFVNVQSAGADFSLSVAASKYIPIENLAIIAGLRFIKLVSASAEAADRSITLATCQQRSRGGAHARAAGGGLSRHRRAADGGGDQGDQLYGAATLYRQLGG